MTAPFEHVFFAPPAPSGWLEYKLLSWEQLTLIKYKASHHYDNTRKESTSKSSIVIENLHALAENICNAVHFRYLYMLWHKLSSIHHNPSINAISGTTVNFNRKCSRIWVFNNEKLYNASLWNVLKQLHGIVNSIQLSKCLVQRQVLVLIQFSHYYL